MSEEDKGQWFEIPERNIEYIEPNLSLAYAEIAPLVTEAFAYIRTGNVNECLTTLVNARRVIDQVSMRMAVFKSEPKPPIKEPGTTWRP